MAKTNTVQFKGTFDSSQILNELKKVRESMSQAGASNALFKNVDKDIATTEKLIAEMMVQIQKGFSNTKEISSFEKQIEKLQTNFLKISTGLKGVNLSENFSFNSNELSKATRELDNLIASQERMQEVSKQALEQTKKSLDFNKQDIQQVQKAIEANENLEEAIKRVAQAKERNAKSNAGKSGIKTDAGKAYIKNASAELSLEDLGATAMSGKTRKGLDDARARGEGGKLKRGGNNTVRLDDDKAMAAVTETYQKALKETIKNGGNAVEAVEAMKRAIAEYGVELNNVEKLQENFAKDLDGFYVSDIIGTGQKSALTKSQKAGKTNAQGEFELSQAGQNAVNNEQLTAYQQNLTRITQLEQEVSLLRQQAAQKAEKAQEEYNNEIKKGEQNINDNTQAVKEYAQVTKDAAETQDKITQGFDKIKDGIRNFLSLGSAVNGLRNVLQQTFEDVKTLDKSFAEIAMVTDYSVGQMWESYDQYAEMANELGQTTESVVQASGLFYQQGGFQTSFIKKA